MATGIGSFPHQDISATCESILNTVPDVPLWPQLANIDFREQMEIQFSEGLPCVVLDEATKRMYFDTSGDLEENLPGWEVIVGCQEASDIPSFVKSVKLT